MSRGFNFLKSLVRSFDVLIIICFGKDFVFKPIWPCCEQNGWMGRKGEDSHSKIETVKILIQQVGTFHSISKQGFPPLRARTTLLKQQRSLGTIGEVSLSPPFNRNRNGCFKIVPFTSEASIFMLTSLQLGTMYWESFELFKKLTYCNTYF